MLSVLEVLAIDDLRLPHVYFSSIFFTVGFAEQDMAHGLLS